MTWTEVAKVFTLCTLVKVRILEIIIIIIKWLKYNKIVKVLYKH